MSYRIKLRVLSHFSHARLCNTMDCSLPHSSVHGILQARILAWLPCPPPGDLPHPGSEIWVSCVSRVAGGFFTAEPPGKPIE